MLEGIASGDASRPDRIEVITDPSTLRPQSVLNEITVELLIDGETERNVERRVSRVAWEESNCQ